MENKKIHQTVRIGCMLDGRVHIATAEYVSAAAAANAAVIVSTAAAAAADVR